MLFILECPVAGAPAMARGGNLMGFASGAEPGFRSAKPILDESIPEGRPTRRARATAMPSNSTVNYLAGLFAGPRQGAGADQHDVPMDSEEVIYRDWRKAPAAQTLWSSLPLDDGSAQVETLEPAASVSLADRSQGSSPDARRGPAPPAQTPP